MQEGIAIQYVCKYLIDVLKRFKFDTKSRVYPVDTEENALMSSIEDVQFFKDRSGYIVMAGIDGMEYVSGNDYSLAIAYNGSRPNINYTQLPIENIEESQRKTLATLKNGEGYITYPWIDPNLLIHEHQINRSYVKMYDDYLYFNVTYAISIGPKGDSALCVVMCDVVQQLLGNYLMYNKRAPTNRIPRFLQAINDGHVFLIDGDQFILGTPNPVLLKQAKAVTGTYGGGFIGKNTFVTFVPYYNYIVGYTI